MVNKMAEAQKLATHTVEYASKVSNKEIRKAVKVLTGFEVRRMDSFTLVGLEAIYGLFNKLEKEFSITDKLLKNKTLGLYGVAEYFSTELLQGLLISVKDQEEIRPVDFISTVGNAANFYIAKLFDINGPNIFSGASKNAFDTTSLLANTDLSLGLIDYAVILVWQETEDVKGCEASFICLS